MDARKWLPGLLITVFVLLLGQIWWYGQYGDSMVAFSGKYKHGGNRQYNAGDITEHRQNSTEEITLNKCSILKSGVCIHMVANGTSDVTIIGPETIPAFQPRDAPSCGETMDPYFYNLCRRPNGPDRPHISEPHLLTLFTTMNVKPVKMYIFNNTIHLWSKLRPKVRPVLFVHDQIDGQSFLREACDSGWDVTIAPQCNKFNYPVIKAMYEVIHNHSRGLFYGFANGDILFDTGLIDTLEYFHSQRSLYPAHLLVGRRKNLMLDKEQAITSFSELWNLAKPLKWHIAIAIDYFISINGGFPWQTLPPFVVGCAGFDQWLVAYAVSPKTNVTGIDCSNTVLAVHQGVKGIWTGHRTSAPGGKYNIKWLNYHGIGIGKGTIKAIRLKTVSEINNTISIK